MALDPAQLPDDIATLKAMLTAADTRASDTDAEIQNLKLTIAKLQRDKFGAKSERGAKLLDQLELQLAELETSVAQDRVSTELANPDVMPDAGRQKPARRPLPAHLRPCEAWLRHDVSASYMRAPHPALAAAAGYANWARTLLRRWNMYRRRGRSLLMCARSSPAANAKP